MACLYTAEGVFIAYMGIKKATISSALGFVPLGVTIAFHRFLKRTLILPAPKLSLESAARVDEEHGEFSLLDKDWHPYRQPALDSIQDEREPMPYRRESEI